MRSGSPMRSRAEPTTRMLGANGSSAKPVAALRTRNTRSPLPTARCGAVSVRREGEDIAVVHGVPEDPRVLRAVLALLRAVSPEQAWHGRLLDRDGADALPAAAPAR